MQTLQHQIRFATCLWKQSRMSNWGQQSNSAMGFTDLLINMAVFSDYNSQTKDMEKNSKYVDIQTECQRMWNEVEVVLIIIDATVVIKKNLNHLSRIPGHHNVHSTEISFLYGCVYILKDNTIYQTRLDSPDIPKCDILGVGYMPYDVWVTAKTW